MKQSKSTTGPQRTFFSFINRKRAMNFVFILLFWNIQLFAQNTLSLDSLWDGAYDAERLESIRSMKDGTAYTVLKPSLLGGTNQVVQYYYKNPKQ